MANGEEESGVATTRELLDTIFGNLKNLDAADKPSRIFPNGLGSLDLEIGFGGTEKPEFHLAFKIAGAPTAPAFSITAEAEDGEFAVAFNTEGHHVIALIAMRDLKGRSPEVMQRVQTILSDGDRTIREAAVFPDAICNQHPETKPFHFVDIPLENGGPVDPPLPGPPHVLVKIADYTAFLKAGGGSAEEKVDALSWLIHLFGDVHQPLHCIERTNDLHPGGDRGGNSFQLKGAVRNLHSLWDSSVNILAHKGEDELVEEILQEHTRDSLASDLQTVDPEAWARASFRLAKTHAYALTENPQNPPKPSRAYLENMEKIGHRQAALAGYRLSDRLVAIFQ
jgi:hypothetical protein